MFSLSELLNNKIVGDWVINPPAVADEANDFITCTELWSRGGMIKAKWAYNNNHSIERIKAEKNVSITRFQIMFSLRPKF